MVGQGRLIAPGELKCPRSISRYRKDSRFWVAVFLVLAVLVLPARVPAAEDALLARGGLPIHRELLPHSQDHSKAIQLFWTKPEGKGPFPAVLFIHGHQETQRNGGEAYVLTGRLGVTARRGYVAAAVSQPGYGNSAGPPDYCGPYRQRATLVAIDFCADSPSLRQTGWRSLVTAAARLSRLW
jgi:hypothetical protein